MSSIGEFAAIRRLVEDRCGVELGPEKEYLTQARLIPHLGRWDCTSLADLTAKALRDPHGELAGWIAESLVPNETFFFRDPGLYQALETQVIPKIIQRNARSKRMAIWSAAASSGQEPCSVALLIREKFPQLANWEIRIDATDISRQMVTRMRRNLFTQLEVNRGLPAHYLAKYFTRSEEGWSVSKEVRQLMHFAELDLRYAWPWIESFDLILARNVLIYFGKGLKKDLLARFRDQLGVGGMLFLGASETTLFLDSDLSGTSFAGAIGYQAKG